MSATTDLEALIGFPPNSGHGIDEDKVRNNVAVQNLVRTWLQKQGIPYKAAKSAIPSSLASAYVNARYLKAWRNRLNPDWDLLGGGDSDDDFPLGAKPLAPNVPAFTNPVAKPETKPEASEAWLKALFAQINDTVNKLTDEKLAKANLKLDESAKEAIRQLARSAASDKVAELAKPQVIEIHDKVKDTITSLGLQHEKFPILLRAAQARDHRGFKLNIWLTGATGSGKTSSAENVSKALNLPFGSDGSLDADYKVLGFRDANGHIISTQFLEIYAKGGIYVADEIDNWLPSALLSLNAALANGWCSSPSGLIPRHKDCCVIACANTWGLGATSDYVGRTRLDAASLDRFQPKINWPYDEKLERAIAQNMGGDAGVHWHGIVKEARHKVQAQGLKIIVSPRATFNGISLLQAGFSPDEVVDMTIAAGLSPEQKRAIGFVAPLSGEAFARSAA